MFNGNVCVQISELKWMEIIWNCLLLYFQQVANERWREKNYLLAYLWTLLAEGIHRNNGWRANPPKVSNDFQKQSWVDVLFIVITQAGRCLHEEHKKTLQRPCAGCHNIFPTLLTFLATFINEFHHTHYGFSHQYMQGLSRKFTFINYCPEDNFYATCTAL